MNALSVHIPDDRSEPFDRAFLTSCSQEERRALEAEVNAIAARYAPGGDAAALAAAAKIFDAYAERFEHGRNRLRLWAALLRRRTDRARRAEARQRMKVIVAEARGAKPERPNP